MPPPTRPGPSHGVTLRLTVSTGAASGCSAAPLPEEPLVMRTIAPVTATAVPAIPHTIATRLAVFPDDSVDGLKTCGIDGLDDSWVSLSPKFLARIPSTTATTSAATPTPTIVQPTPRRAFEGGVGGTTTTTGPATTSGGGVTTGSGATATGFGAGLIGTGGGGVTAAAALRRSSISFSMLTIFRFTSSRLRASGERCKYRR